MKGQAGEAGLMAAVAGSLGERGRRVTLSGGQSARLSLTGCGDGRDAAELSCLGDGDDDVIHRNRKPLAHVRNRKKCNAFARCC